MAHDDEHGQHDPACQADDEPQHSPESIPGEARTRARIDQRWGRNHAAGRLAALASPGEDNLRSMGTKKPVGTG